MNTVDTIEIKKLDAMPELAKDHIIITMNSRDGSRSFPVATYQISEDYPHPATYGLTHHDHRSCVAYLCSDKVYKPSEFSGQVILDFRACTNEGLGIYAFNISDIPTDGQAFSLDFQGDNADKSAGIFKITIYEMVS